MIKLLILASLLVVFGKCQLLRDEDRPTRYVLPYSGLSDELEAKDDHYYRPNRRTERIPVAAYQYEEAEDEYYQPQVVPKSRQKVDESFRYQSTPSHKDYEEILKNNHLARLRVAAKKQSQPQAQQPVEQYLKEVNPTTKTSYQRPTNYLRYIGQNPALKQEQNEETTLKRQSYRYVLQPEQKSFQQYQFEASQPQPKPPRFNLVAYQKALLTQQKLLAAQNQEDGPAKSTIYVGQTLPKPTKKPKTQSRQPSGSNYDYYSQGYIQEPAPVRYQQVLPPRGAYYKTEASPAEDGLIYQEQKDVEYQTQAPSRQTKQHPTRLPKRKPKYQTEETAEVYQTPVGKYQQDEQAFDLKYQDETAAYRRPVRPSKLVTPEEQSDVKDEYLYQRATLPRRDQQQYVPEPEARPSRYLSRQQYQEETKQLPQYQSVDLAYQPTTNIPVREIGRGPSVSYRHLYPQNQYDRRQFTIKHLVQSTQEELYVIPNKPSHLKTQKMLPSTPYNPFTQSKILKLSPVQDFYEAEASKVYRKQKTVKARKPKKQRTTYLNGQLFQEEVKPYYQTDLDLQSSKEPKVRSDNSEPFLIVVYDE